MILFRLLFRWIKSIFAKDTKRYITHKTADVIKQPIKSKKTHDERLQRFKETFKEKHYPETVGKSYSRSYERYMMNKKRKEQKHALALQGKRLNDKGNVINVQKPYRKTEYPSLHAYNRYSKLFNYTGK